MTGRRNINVTVWIAFLHRLDAMQNTDSWQFLTCLSYIIYRSLWLRVHAILRGHALLTERTQAAFAVTTASEFDGDRHSYAPHVLTIPGWQILQPVPGSLVSELTLAVGRQTAKTYSRATDHLGVMTVAIMTGGLILHAASLQHRWIMHRVDASSRSDFVGIAGNSISTP